MKVSELQGAALDWAVAKCEGVAIIGFKQGRTWAIYIDPADDGALNEMRIDYSTDWAQGGPIIERERIRLDPRGVWVAGHDSSNDEYSGPTPLIAAMRCYVASKLGDEIERPEELNAQE